MTGIKSTDMLAAWAAQQTEREAMMILQAVGCVLSKLGQTEVLITQHDLMDFQRDFHAQYETTSPAQEMPGGVHIRISKK